MDVRVCLFSFFGLSDEVSCAEQTRSNLPAKSQEEEEENMQDERIPASSIPWNM